MLSIAHGPLGAFIVKAIPNPILGLPTAVLAHYICDRVPHWDVGQGITNQGKKKSHSFLQELFFDFPGSILLTYLFFQVGKPFDPYIWLGWFAGLLPDFIEFPRLFLGYRFAPLDIHHKFHKWLHVSTPNRFWGLLPQIIVLLGILLFKS